MPVTQQPSSLDWFDFSKASTNQNVRPGLEVLAGLSSIHLKQKIDFLEVMTGWQVKNKFRITDPETGQIIGLFKEESGCCERQCCKNGRSFTADIVGPNNQVLFKLDRPLACQCFCCPDTTCCGCPSGQQMTVLDSQSQQIGFMTQEKSCHVCCCFLDWGLNITDQNGQFRYKMGNNVCKATCCEKASDCCCTDKFLYIYDASQRQVGRVVKKWRGCATEACTPADSLLIEFPGDATAEDKANLIAATLLSDYNLWEQQNNNN